MPLLDDAKFCYVGTQSIKTIMASDQIVWPKETISDFQFYHLTTSDSYNSQTITNIYVSWRTDRRPDSYDDVPDTLRLQWTDDPPTTANPRWNNINWSKQSGSDETSRISAMPPSEDGLMVMVAYNGSQAGGFKDRRFRVAVGTENPSGQSTLKFSSEHVLSGLTSENPTWDQQPPLPIEWLHSNRDGILHIVLGIRMYDGGTLYNCASFGIYQKNTTCRGFSESLQWRVKLPDGKKTVWKYMDQGHYTFPSNPDGDGFFPCGVVFKIVPSGDTDSDKWVFEVKEMEVPLTGIEKEGVAYSALRTSVMEYDLPPDWTCQLICR